MSKRSRQRKRRQMESVVRRATNAGLLTPNTLSVAEILAERMSGGHLPIKAASLDTSNLREVKEWPANWPLCPKAFNPEEWRRSLEAMEHYCLAATEPGKTKPWFQYPKFTHQYSELVFVTPEMALELLAYMPVNRTLKEKCAQACMRDIQNERWIQSHESIAINTQGNMHDGQHRAKGIILAGRGWPMYMTWNVPPEALYITDSGARRKINEKLGLLYPEEKITANKAAVCRAMMWGLNRNTQYSESEIAEFFLKYHDVINWISSRLKNIRADIQAVLAKAILWWGEAVVAPFVDRFCAVQFTGEGDPAKALYLWTQSARKEGKRTYANPLVYYKKTLSAITAAAAGKEAKKIYQKQGDIFEWEQGWKVPDSAPCSGNVWLPKVEETPEAGQTVS